MNSVKGKGRTGWMGVGQTVDDEMFDHAISDDWSDETAELQQLRLALIQAGRAAVPRHDPARLDRVFRRIMARLAEEERDGVPASRLDTPSGVTAKMFG